MDTIQNNDQAYLKQKPRWLARKLPKTPDYGQIRGLIRDKRLHTVCQEAGCPNRYECFSMKTATFLILGAVCTRNCGFCNVTHGSPMPPDPDEPMRIAEAAQAMNLEYVVVTSVTRDDLPDGGASLFAETILQIRRKLPDARIEVLIPDFQGDYEALRVVLNARPHVLNHNIETVRSLYPVVRPQAIYDRSLELLGRAAADSPNIPAKSGIMLGIGETTEEIRETLKDILHTGCHLLTLGQYLQPSKNHLPVKHFVPPDEFDQWRDIALTMGFDYVISGPLVRSSYHAKELFVKMALSFEM